MKFISWNIDSLNAALTSDSARALLTRDVLASIAESGARYEREAKGSSRKIFPRL